MAARERFVVYPAIRGGTGTISFNIHPPLRDYPGLESEVAKAIGGAVIDRGQVSEAHVYKPGVTPPETYRRSVIEAIKQAGYDAITIERVSSITVEQVRAAQQSVR
jgi:hypothetical protein